MSLTRLKARHSSQKRYLKSRQEEMAKPIEDTKPLPIILSWAYKILILVFFGLILIFPFYFMINESFLIKIDKIPDQEIQLFDIHMILIQIK